jgi:hypothetical protein
MPIPQISRVPLVFWQVTMLRLFPVKRFALMAAQFFFRQSWSEQDEGL